MNRHGHAQTGVSVARPTQGIKALGASHRYETGVPVFETMRYGQLGYLGYSHDP